MTEPGRVAHRRAAQRTALRNRAGAVGCRGDSDSPRAIV